MKQKGPYSFLATCLLISAMLLLQSSDLLAQSKASVDKINQKEYGEILENVRSSISIFSQNAKDAHSIGYKKGEATAYGKLALAQYIAGEIDQSTQSYLKAIKLWEKIGDKKALSGIYSEFGYSLKRYNMPQAKQYMRLAIQIAEKQGYHTELPNHYNNYGVIHEIDNNIDSAIYFYRKALQLSKANNDRLGIPYCLNNLSGAYSIKQDYARAHEYLDQSDAYRATEKDAFGKTENLSLRGDLFLKEARYRQAQAVYTKARQLALQNHYSQLVLHSTEALSTVYEALNQPDSALFYLHNLKAFSDSLNSSSREKQLLQLEAEYNAARKDKELAEKNLQVRNGQIQLLVIGSIATILLVLAFLIWRTQKARRMRIKLEAENKMKQEKIRISRELHDNIGSQLTFMISSIENTGHQVDGTPKQALDEVTDFGRNTLQDLRTTVWAMKNEQGTLDDLVLRIQSIQKMIPDGIHFTTEINGSGDFKLSAPELLNTYRIVQEFVQNSLKHAHPSTIHCVFNVEASTCRLVLSDDGIGFDPQKHSFGNGLNNMRDRAAEIGADFRLDAAEREGTRATLTFIRH